MIDPKHASSLSDLQNSGVDQQNTSVLYQSTELFRGKSEILIEHEGVTYRLLITRHGKLLLNK